MDHQSAAPDVIPEDVQASYVKEARRVVRGKGLQRARFAIRGQRRALGAAPVSPAVEPAASQADAVVSDRRPGIADESAVVAGVLLAFVGAFALTAVWAWLAVTTPDAFTWWTMTSLGAALTLAVAAVLARLLLAGPSAAPALAKDAVRRERRSAQRR